MESVDLSSFAVVGLILLAVVLVVLLGVTAFLVLRLVRLFGMVRSDAMPVSGKVTFWAALIYAIFPIDVLPDPIYLDDVGVLTAALAILSRLITKHGVADRVLDRHPRRRAPDERTGGAQLPA